MLVIKGNKQIEISKFELQEIFERYEKTILDIGAGDGRFVFKTAQKEPQKFFVALEPNKEQLEIYSKKTQRKKIVNAIFVLGSIEMFPQELFGEIDTIHINLPWGSLLKEVVSPSRDTVDKFMQILKYNGRLNLLLGYDKEFEPSETSRLKLPEISEDYIQNSLIPFYERTGFSLAENKLLSKIELKEFETTWSKKLAFGANRKIFFLSFEKNK